MLLKIFIILLLIKSNVSYSQQNFFNAPSFEITSEDHIFFQEQLNFFNHVESNATFDYGLKNQQEIGFNLYSLDFNNPQSDNNVLLLMNYQKIIIDKLDHKFGLGTQLGYRRKSAKHYQFAMMDYLSYSYTGIKKLLISGGPWYANAQYTNESFGRGIQLGIDYQIVEEKLHLIIDTISGNSPMSVTVIGFSYYIDPHIPLSIG